MSTDSQNFISNLPNLFIIYDQLGKSVDTMKAGLDQDAGGAANSTFFIQDVANGFFPNAHETFQGFIETLINNSGNFPGTFSYDANKTSSATFQAFIDYYKAAVGISTAAGAPNTDLGDWEPLRALLSQDPNHVLTVDQFAEQNLIQAFNKFITSYSFTSTTTTTEFLTNWKDFLTVDSSLVTDVAGNGQGIQSKNITSFHDLYFQFVPGATEAGFTSTLQNFYKDSVAKDGFFLPSQNLGDWFSLVLTTKEVNPLLPPRSTQGGNFNKTAIIFELLRLVEGMVGSLQTVAATQANRLSFYSNAQKAYTDLIQKVPVMTQAQIKLALKGPTDEQINSLVTQISSINNAYAENLRSYRSIMGDEAKQQQTVVNQTKEAVNQQGDLFTSLLQQLSTILASIYR